jgi:molybdopterin-guanine dinucleotide biosynthesis protein B
VKALAVIGYHHSGKTTVVTELVKHLSISGFKVATIKDIHNEDYRADTEGKNSWQHINAGAVSTFARGLYDTSLIFPKPLTLKEMTTFLKCDYLIIEGIKDAPVPKILCAETTVQLDDLCDETVFSISGKIARDIQEWHNLPVFNINNSTEALVSLVKDKVFELLPNNDPDCCSACGLSCYDMVKAILKGEKQRSDCRTDHQQEIELNIDGKPVVLGPFVQKLFKDLLLSFLSNLKDTDTKGNISIEIKQHDGKDG